ncbi:ISL3 family transposase [Deinococcus apachensis]|uniref:ISL3 family transposase n=1 Tax=Deinococcus apachensis TaxID=309886 RepID=UPI00035C290C|nr:ISL3 family transposase [Deinococcus apachensis]
MAVELSTLLSPWFGKGLIVKHLALDGSTLHLKVISAASDANCPLCGQRSYRLHSRSTRTLHDLPFGGFPTVVHLRLHRFRCLQPDCVRRVFCERLPLLVTPYAQRTLRCTRALTHLASTASGRGGARLGTQLDLTASASTLIRQLHRPLVLPPCRLLHVGIDDFAFRKGQTYGTVIVDLDTHRPVEILPDRTTTVVADWLRQHPEIELVTRDRSTEFACAVTQSLPNAVQVLDRWHLLKNLREALERFLGRHQNVLRETTPAPKPRSQAGEDVRAQRQQRRMALLVQMQVLRAAGLGTRVIARHLGVSRYLVKRYLQADAVPARRAHTRVRSILDPYLAFLNRRWDEGCRVGAQLLREVQSLGYPGTRRPLDSWLRARRAGAPLPSPAEQQAALYEARAQQLIEIESTLPAKISPQELVWL